MPTRRELYAGVTFFALSALAVIAFRRPFDLVGWACLAACVAFVAVGCVSLLKPNLVLGKSIVPARAGGRLHVEANYSFDEAAYQEPIGDPSAEELSILGATIAALEAVGGLEKGEIDAEVLWTAAQRLDPGQTVGIHEALGSFSALHDFGRTRIGRLTFVPAHTEYGRPLIAEIAASALLSLGHSIGPADIDVELPPGGNEGTASIRFPMGNRHERITCHYRWKYPPDDLIPALSRFSRDEDPRDLVSADPGDQTLVLAAIRSGTLAELNRRLPAEHDLFSVA